jgi:hypothetical protein
MPDTPILYWDACMFYEVLGNEAVDSRKRTGIQQILAANDKGENFIITSVITHLEVLPSKLQGKGADYESDYLALFDGIKFGEIEINTNILLRAREIRDYYYTPANENGQGGKMMDLGDAIHLAVASIHRASEFHTRDSDKKGTKVPLLRLYEMSGNPKLCGKYDLAILSPESQQGVFDLDTPMAQSNGE